MMSCYRLSYFVHRLNSTNIRVLVVWEVSLFILDARKILLENGLLPALFYAKDISPLVISYMV